MQQSKRRKLPQSLEPTGVMIQKPSVAVHPKHEDMLNSETCGSCMRAGIPCVVMHDQAGKLYSGRPLPRGWQGAAVQCGIHKIVCARALAAAQRPGRTRPALCPAASTRHSRSWQEYASLQVSHGSRHAMGQDAAATAALQACHMPRSASVPETSLVSTVKSGALMLLQPPAAGQASSACAPLCPQ
jgi:hypothetical protein